MQGARRGASRQRTQPGLAPVCRTKVLIWLDRWFWGVGEQCRSGSTLPPTVCHCAFPPPLTLVYLLLGDRVRGCIALAHMHHTRGLELHCLQAPASTYEAQGGMAEQAVHATPQPWDIAQDTLPPMHTGRLAIAAPAVLCPAVALTRMPVSALPRPHLLGTLGGRRELALNQDARTRGHENFEAARLLCHLLGHHDLQDGAGEGTLGRMEVSLASHLPGEPLGAAAPAPGGPVACPRALDLCSLCPPVCSQSSCHR